VDAGVHAASAGVGAADLDLSAAEALAGIEDERAAPRPDVERDARAGRGRREMVRVVMVRVVMVCRCVCHRYSAPSGAVW
jgi:hypothetical protein